MAKRSKVVVIFLAGIALLALTIIHQKQKQPEIPVGSNPFGVPEEKIQRFLKEARQDDPEAYKDIRNAYFVDSDDDYRLLGLTGGFPIDVRYRTVSVPEEVNFKTFREKHYSEDASALYALWNNGNIEKKGN